MLSILHPIAVEVFYYFKECLLFLFLLYYVYFVDGFYSFYIMKNTFICSLFYFTLKVIGQWCNIYFSIIIYIIRFYTTLTSGKIVSILWLNPYHSNYCIHIATYSQFLIKMWLLNSNTGSIKVFLINASIELFWSVCWVVSYKNIL